jgi:glycosyltransferase involved in cell wall biosynthesis
MKISEAEKKPVLSVITPTYNRAHLLDRVYESLLAQTEFSFEWIVADDGSDDETEQKVTVWIKSAPFPIHYTYQENQGKAAAFNHAVRLASGQFLFCLDSDDWFPEDSVANQIALMESHVDNPKICGLTGISKLPDGTVVGKAFPEEGLIASKQALNDIAPGDKPNVFKTEILKCFLFPSFPGEKFLPESTIYNRMFQSGYSFVSTNTTLQIVEYQGGGLSDRALELRLANLNGIISYYHEMSLMDFPIKTRLRTQSNLVRYSLHKLGAAKFLHHALTMIPAALVGALFYVRDKLRIRQK